MSVIKNIKIENIRKTVPDKYRRYMPTTLIPQEVSFELHNVNVGFANAVRRTLLNECLIKCMSFEVSAYSCTNPYMLNDYVLGRVQCIPIAQNMTATFKLDITNDAKTRIAQVHRKYDRLGKLNDYEIKQKELDLKAAALPQSMTVLSGDMTCNLKQLPFNETFEIATLDEGNMLKIDPITIIEGYGYDHARHNMVALASCVPLDQNPIDLHTGKGVPAGLANPRIHKISFKTNGIMSPHEMIRLACKSLEERLIFIKGLKDEFKSINNEHTLVINGETHTIGNLLMKTIVDNEQVEGITYYPDNHVRSMTLRIKTDNDIKKIMDKTITSILDLLKIIEKNVK
jgi:DNA-directed RNA polymerase subunit L